MTGKNGFDVSFPKTDVHLFSTNTDVMAVDGPVKSQILDLLAIHDLYFDEIVTRTGKAKSTVSVHIQDLEQAGLVSSVPDPNDMRKRIISLRSESIGRLTNTDRDAPDRLAAGDVIPVFRNGEPGAFFRHMISIFRSEAMHLGINVDPVFLRTGMRVGEILSSTLTAGSTEDLVAEMNQFWESNSLGSIRLVQSDPVILQVEGCFECKDLPVTGHGACAFDTGVLMKIFRKHLGVPVIVTEEECYSSGFNHCRFRIQPEQMREDKKV